ncbi:MAG: class I SAM-dependent methyltransferase [Chloroflexi bacterium]|nr:class I SAM-dependent methyltransferase [Chloroflexota bacterium]
MPGDYAVLASVYDDIGLNSFAQRMTPILVDFAQQRDWLGRRFVVLGCGTGASVEYLSNYMYTIVGVDNSPQMLAAARQKLDQSGASVRWLEADIRELGDAVGHADMVLALNVLNELNSLRDLEVVFTQVHRILEPGKLFIFDLHTIQGLTEQGRSGDAIVTDSTHLSVFVSDEYDYERQMATRHYLIFRRQGESWQRSEARHVLRGFPVQAVASLLQRAGLKVNGIFQLDLDPYEPGVSQASRVVFLVEKP